MAGKKRAKPKRPLPPSQRRGVRIYTLKVTLIRGPISDEFDRANPVVSRTLAMRGDQTLADLHWAVFDAFDRDDEHMYEFQFGERPMDPRARCYGMAEDTSLELDHRSRLADHARLDDVGLIVGLTFFYWFDFGDDWWHRIQVVAIENAPPGGAYPREVGRVGPSPPQSSYDEDSGRDEDDPEGEEDPDDEHDAGLDDLDFDELEALADEDLLEEAEFLKQKFPQLSEGDLIDFLKEAEEFLRKEAPELLDEVDDDEPPPDSRKPEAT
ncbi:plasmid pRiA4b ORF-3 family protein [Paludisphaera soli]|uniref:plasmid pRiA4b ORF-3 family protein n=1 Tax=Paludisphaera soli TaxID=2712865 RepID=UPI0013EC1E7F|nr:plasmid pRiA4b ORF-3 family protein [Paludisphaera soli]